MSITLSTGMPARNMVLNCLVNRINSSGWTLLNIRENRLPPASALPASSRIDSGARPRPASNSLAWSGDWASIKPATVFPWSFTAS